MLVARHRFAPGDRVVLKVPAPVFGPRGPFRVMLLLPMNAGENMYRVKSDHEQHERVIGESRLTYAA